MYTRTSAYCGIQNWLGRVFKQWWWSAATSLRKGDIVEGNGEGDLFQGRKEGERKIRFVFKTPHMEQCHGKKRKYPIYYVLIYGSTIFVTLLHKQMHHHI
jgi:hypothetical protein